jgi:stress response protein SCP2
MRDEGLIQRVNGWTAVTPIIQLPTQQKEHNMSSFIKSGETSSFTKDAAAAGETLASILVGLGWDPAEEGKPVDLDLMAFCLGTDGQLVDASRGFVFFGNQSDASGAFKLSDDDTTGESSEEGDDETLTIDLAKVPAEVAEIAIWIYSFSGQPFTAVKNVGARIVNAANDKELVKYEADQLSGRGTRIGSLKRDGLEWTFTADGVTSTTEDLEPFSKGFGYIDPKA